MLREWRMPSRVPPSMIDATDPLRRLKNWRREVKFKPYQSLKRRTVCDSPSRMGDESVEKRKKSSEELELLLLGGLGKYLECRPVRVAVIQPPLNLLRLSNWAPPSLGSRDRRGLRLGPVNLESPALEPETAKIILADGGER